MCIPLLAALPAFLGGTAAAGTAAAGTAAVAGTATAAASTAATIASYAGLAGSLLSAVGAIQQGQQGKGVAEYNSDVAKMQAVDARRRGSEAEAQHRQQAAIFMGKQRALMGGSGAVVDEGSFGDVLAQSAEFSERDAQQARINAERQAWGYEAQAAGSRYQGQAAETSSYYRAGSSMIGFAASPAGASLLGGDQNFFRSRPYYDSWRNQG